RRVVGGPTTSPWFCRPAAGGISKAKSRMALEPKCSIVATEYKSVSILMKNLSGTQFLAKNNRSVFFQLSFSCQAVVKSENLNSAGSTNSLVCEIAVTRQLDQNLSFQKSLSKIIQDRFRRLCLLL